MKFLFLVTGIREELGGIQSFNAAVKKGLEELGHQVKIISLDSLKGRRKKIVFVGQFIANLLRDPPDIIFYGHINFYLIALSLGIFCPKKYVVFTHGVEVWNLDNRLKKRFLRKASLVVAVSHFTKKKLVEGISISASKIFILPNTVNVERFKIKQRSEKIVKRHGLQDKKVLLTVARLEQRKGYDKVIRALPQIIKELPNIKYLLVGKGDDLPRIKGLVEERGLEEYVEFCGFVSNQELVDYYNLADVFVMPSKGEGFGIVFLEALACGTPVIAGNQDASREPLLNGELGLLVDPDNKEEIAKAVVKILKGDVRQELLNAQYLRKKTIENFGSEKFRERLKTLIERIK